MAGASARVRVRDTQGHRGSPSGRRSLDVHRLVLFHITQLVANLPLVSMFTMRRNWVGSSIRLRHSYLRELCLQI